MVKQLSRATDDTQRAPVPDAPKPGFPKRSRNGLLQEAQHRRRRRMLLLSTGTSKSDLNRDFSFKMMRLFLQNDAPTIADRWGTRIHGLWCIMHYTTIEEPGWRSAKDGASNAKKSMFGTIQVVFYLNPEFSDRHRRCFERAKP